MIGQVLYSDEDVAMMEAGGAARDWSSESWNPSASPAPTAPQYTEEDVAGMQAWATLLVALELSPDASQEQVGQALIARGIAPGDVADWLPACNYDVVCFTETLHYEMAQAQQRQKNVRAAIGLSLVGLVVIGVAGYVLLKRRR